MGRPRLPRLICPVCKEKECNWGAETCSNSCAGILRWERLRARGYDAKAKAIERARKTSHARRIQQKIKEDCEELGIELTPQIAKLYIRSRNRGYYNGYVTGFNRKKKS